MSGKLNHSAADVILELLLQAGLASRTTADDEWPGTYNYMPDNKDMAINWIAVYDTSAIVHDRIQNTGRYNEDPGVQIRVRGDSEVTGWTKAKAIQDHLDLTVKRTTVIYENTTYLVHSWTRAGDILRLGTGPDTDSRSFTLNGLITLTMQ